MNCGKWVRIICLLGMSFSFFCLLMFGNQYRKGRKEYKELTLMLPEKADGFKPANRALGDEMADWEEKLRQINPDYKGWLYIPNTGINYPLVQGNDSDYYLNHTFKGEKNSCGCLFLDADSDGADSDNVIIFGHNRKDGSMFGGLKEYINDDFLKKHKNLWISFEGKWIRGVVVSCRVIGEDNHEVYQYRFSSEEERKEYLETMGVDSYFFSGSYENGDRWRRILTLSSCMGKTQRVIVQAVLLCYTE